MCISSFLKENLAEMLYGQNDRSPYYQNNAEKLVILTSSFKREIIRFQKDWLGSFSIVPSLCFIRYYVVILT